MSDCDIIIENYNNSVKCLRGSKGKTDSFTHNEDTAVLKLDYYVTVTAAVFEFYKNQLLFTL